MLFRSVFRDLDNDGIQDAGEPGISGVTVTLFTSGNVQVGASTVTNASGFYSFTDIDPGNYYVVFTAPAGQVFATQFAAGSTTANDSNADATGKSDTFALASGVDNNTIDAGFLHVSDAAFDRVFETAAFRTDRIAARAHDEVGARSWLARAGFRTKGGAELKATYRTLDNQTYGGVDYERAHLLDVRYSRRWRQFTVGGEANAGRDSFGESFSRISVFIRY